MSNTVAIATIYMNQCVAQLAKTAIYKTIFYIKNVLNKCVYRAMALVCRVAHHKACVKIWAAWIPVL